MRMNKFFMLGLVGLAFAACNNEEDLSNQLPEGSGAVTIKIVSPAMTRTVETGTTANSVIVKGDVTITLEASNGNKTINLTAEELATITDGKVTFWNVETPTKVTVSMNGGKNSYEDVEPTAFKDIAPAAIHAYGETSSFKLTEDTGSPTLNNDNESTMGNKSEQGADDGDQNKTYQLYSASVQLTIPVARLEVSGIQHITTSGSHTADDCAYQTLTIAGVYLDNVYATGAGVTYANGAFPCVTGIAPTDYSYDGDHGSGIKAILSDQATPTDFLTQDQVWPVAGQAYSYYFFGADGEDNLPKFKIYFDTSVAKDSDSPLPAPRYAMITKYWNEDRTAAITKFEPGHIYRITSAQLSDENIIGDEGGNTLYGVEVTVKEATWTVQTIEADWAGDN